MAEEGHASNRSEVDGARLAARAFELGLAVMRADGSRRPIPIGAEPVVLAGEEIARRSALSATLVAATAKVARDVLGGPQRATWLDALRPIERRLVEATWRGLDRLATARVDFSARGATLAALEVNATIPAMQGYSDIAAQAWIESAGARAGLSRTAIDALVARNGSNSQALLDALERAWAGHRPREPLRTIAILARRGDAQATELEWLRAKFERAGYEAAIVHPDEVGAADPLTARGIEWQLVYRHLFASRLDEAPHPLVEAALAGWNRGASLVVNPPSAQLEMKATFAQLSMLGDDPREARRVGLTDEELDAIRAIVPWTRPLLEGGAVLPGGAPVANLAAAIAADPARYVIKRSWSYGGTGVFVGAEAGTDAFRERLERAFGDEVRDWAALCERAAQEGQYIVQHAVDTELRETALHTPDSHVHGTMRLDYAAYASLGIAAKGWGGVVRAAPSAIVNIAGGGGVVPLVTREVADALYPSPSGRRACPGLDPGCPKGG